MGQVFDLMTLESVSLIKCASKCASNELAVTSQNSKLGSSLHSGAAGQRRRS